MSKANVENPVEQQAMIYLEDQAYSALLGYKEPVRSAEIIGAIGKEEYSAKLLRHVLAASSRFAQIDRRWDLEIRYEDKQRPLERVLNEVIHQYGHPMSVQQIANELSSVYERPAEYYETLAARMLTDEDKYFHTSDELYGLRVWLLDVTSSEEDDVIFDNDLDEEEISSLEKAVAKVDWSAEDIGAAVNKFLDAVKSPVHNRMVSFFRWRAQGDDFDSVATFDALYQTSKLEWLSDHRWSSNRMVEDYQKLLINMADQISEEIAEDASQAVVEKAEISEDVAPTPSLSISERDLDEISQIITAKGKVKMSEILETIFEISPRDPVYEVAAEGLGDAMRNDARFAWIGAERWRKAETLPEHIKVVPPELEIPQLSFETPEGEPLEVELEDEGLEGGLAKEIHNPLVQDVNDRDPITEQDELPPADFARCVLTRHHKKLGTFPLVQIPKTFFPIGPRIMELTLTDGKTSREIWVNQETGLIQDMGKWYTDEMTESGAVFHLVKTDDPDVYTFEPQPKPDPLVHIGPSRIEELLAIAEEVKESDVPTFDLIYRLMPAHKKGVPYITLFTEVNIVRRTTRRLVASILSSHYAFYQRPKTALWQYDEKKKDQGFKKAKKKYVRKA